MNIKMIMIFLWWLLKRGISGKTPQHSTTVPAFVKQTAWCRIPIKKLKLAMHCQYCSLSWNKFVTSVTASGTFNHCNVVHSDTMVHWDNPKSRLHTYSVCMYYILITIVYCFTSWHSKIPTYVTILYQREMIQYILDVIQTAYLES